MVKQPGRKLRTRRSGVRISQGAPFLCFCPLADQVKGLSVFRIKTYAIGGAVRKHHSQQFALFAWILPKIQRIGQVGEF